MENRDPSHDDHLGYRSAEPDAASQPLDGCRGLHDQRLADPCIPAAEGAETPSPGPNDLVNVLAPSDPQPEHDDAHPPTWNMGTMGTLTCQTNHALSQAEPPVCPLARPHDVVAMINASGLGHVIGVRQLHRHRALADHSFEFRLGRSRLNVRIDVLRYIAWLFDRVHDKGANPIAGEVSLAGVFAMLEKQSYRCALTGRPLAPENTSLDHLIPVSRGGAHCLGNGQLLQTEVNRAKAALTNDEFIALCREVVAWADRSTTN